MNIDSEGDSKVASPVYLDYAGAALPPPSLLQEAFRRLCSTDMSNPHTAVMKLHGEDVVSAARQLVLDHVRADAHQYDVIFTSGATAAIKLVGETFPMSEGSIFCYAKNSHTSVLGLRHFFANSFCLPGSTHMGAWDCGGAPCEPALQIPTEVFGLIAVPAECNFSGKKIDIAQSAEVIASLNQQRIAAIGTCVKGASHSGVTRWLWLLDAAKYVATSQLDLTVVPPHRRPHFICMSFYKIFGYPTGLGALIVRRDVAHHMIKGYWAGGGIEAAAADSSFAVPRSLGPAGAASNPHEIFEDGTPHFMGISTLKCGFDAISSMGGMSRIQEHTFRLAHHICTRLQRLRHSCAPSLAWHSDKWTGEMCEVYGWGEGEGVQISSATQGSIVSFNIIDALGCYVPFSDVGRLAEGSNITLRTGCFCNVGACQEFLGISSEEVVFNYETGRKCGGADGVGDIINGKPTGAVRVSVGAWTTQTDCDAFIEFVSSTFLNVLPDGATVPEESKGRFAADGGARGLKTMCVNSKETEFYLSRLYVYPIKSCAGLRASAWPLADSGLFLDREWAVIHKKTGRVLTQKSFPRLALCRPTLRSINVERSKTALHPLVNEKKVYLSVSARGMDSVLIIDIVEEEKEKELRGTSSVHPKKTDLPSERCDTGAHDIKSVLVCRKQRLIGTTSVLKCLSTAIDEEQKLCTDADAWFSAFLGESVSVVRRQRGQTIGVEEVANFSNEAQFLMLTECSLQILSKLMQPNRPGQHAQHKESELKDTRKRAEGHGMDAVPESESEDIDQVLQATRFRPNLLLGLRVPVRETLHPPSGCETTIQELIDEEDRWREVEFASTTGGPGPSPLLLTVTGPCSRCQMVNINQTTGVIDGRHLQTLAQYRKIDSRIEFGLFLKLCGILQDRVRGPHSMLSLLQRCRLHQASTGKTGDSSLEGRTCGEEDLCLTEGMTCFPRL